MVCIWFGNLFLEQKYLTSSLALYGVEPRPPAILKPKPPSSRYKVVAIVCKISYTYILDTLWKQLRRIHTTVKFVVHFMDFCGSIWLFNFLHLRTKKTNDHDIRFNILKQNTIIFIIMLQLCSSNIRDYYLCIKMPVLTSALISTCGSVTPTVLPIPSPFGNTYKTVGTFNILLDVNPQTKRCSIKILIWVGWLVSL